MSQTLPFDPLTMWKKIYEQTEASWNDAIQETLKKESFSEGMGETLNYYLKYQELAKETTETYLKQANMPTRSEVADVASLVINLEGKFDDLDEKFDTEMTKLDPTIEISQLKRAVTDLDMKLDKVLEAIELIGNEKSMEVIGKTKSYDVIAKAKNADAAVKSKPSEAISKEKSVEISKIKPSGAISKVKPIETSKELN